MSSAGDIFQEEPVPLADFVTDSGFLGNPPLSPIQLQAVRHLEQIYYPDTYRLMAEEFDPSWAPVRLVNFGWIQWGKGSGKDHIARLLIARVCYLLGCLKDPQRYFGMPSQDTIHVLNVAASEAQARKAFLDPLRRLVQQAPCFLWRFEARASSITFDFGVELISGHSSTETQEGLNLLVGVADEISAFRTDEEVAHLAKESGRQPSNSAGGILRMMISSARTRFPQTFKIVAISYPRFKNDAIQTLTAEGREDNERMGKHSRVLVSGPLPTWAVNPRVDSKELFNDDYGRDPAMARAMYECEPDIRLNQTFRNEAAVRAAFGRPLPEPITVEYSLARIAPLEGSPQTESATTGWRATFRLSESLWPVPGALYVVHADLSLRHNRAGIAMAHVRSYVRSSGAESAEPSEVAPAVKVDFVVSLEADLTVQPPREIQIAWVRNLLLELRGRAFTLARVTLDQFQSADTVQIVRSWGIDTAVVSTDRSALAWETLRDVVYGGRLEAYERPRVVRELLGLITLPGGKVKAPSDGSKDEADAVACAVLGAIGVGGQEQSDTDDSVDFFSGGRPLIDEEWHGPTDFIGPYRDWGRPW